MNSNARSAVLPGFSLGLGTTVLALSILVLLPIAALTLKFAQIPLSQAFEILFTDRAMAALAVTFGLSFAAAVINIFLGGLIAWVLIRYQFPGRRVCDALIDLPFALPTAVAGIALTAVYAKHGLIGRYLDMVGIQVAFTKLGILVALLFITLPFVVRTLQPALEELDAAVEEAALTIGASGWQTFYSIIVPTLLPYLLSSFTLAFARGLGEYGSIVFISGNLPKRTEIISFLIMSKLEQFDYAGATVLAMFMLISSFVLLMLVNTLPRLIVRGR